MRCASLTIGIAEYAHPQYRSSANRLRFAAEDASAFWRYASLAWPEQQGDSLQLLLLDGAATAAAVDTAAGTLAERGPYDLFVVYVSGHGEIASDGTGWFCLADARPRVPSLDASRLDRVISRIAAENVLLFLDCCHAEALTSQLRFFSKLSGTRARLFAASARSTQAAWEEDALRRSVFSDVVLRALSSDSPLRDPTAHVDVESRLFPYVREQVTLLTAAMKRGYEQEPVTGGLAAFPLRLPCVESRSLGRELTVAQTVRARVKRIAAIGTVSFLLLLGALDLLVWHIAVGPTGSLLVRPGFETSYAVTPFHVVPQVDTGFALPDLDQRNSDWLDRLRTGRLRGFSTHRIEPGIRTWLGAVLPGLTAQAQASAQVLARGELARFDANEVPPLTEGLFLARLRGQPLSEIAPTIYPLQLEPSPSCNENPALRINFEILSPSTAVAVEDFRWWMLSAAPDPDARAKRMLEVVQMAAYRAVRRNIDRAGVEQSVAIQESVRELSAISAAVMKVAHDPDAPVLYQHAIPSLGGMSETWCAVHASVVASLLSPGPEGIAAEGELAALLERTAGSESAPLERNHALAAEGLAQLARTRSWAPSTFLALERVLDRQGFDLAVATPANDLLRRVAARQRLHRSLEERLQEALSKPGDDAESNRILAFSILARNARYLNGETTRFLRQWAETHRETVQTFSPFHEGLGFLALADHSGHDVDFLVARLSPGTYFPPRALTYRGASVINSTGDPAAVALGRIGQAAPLDRSVVARLERFAISRPDVEDSDEIIRGVAVQKAFSNSAAAIHLWLATARADAELLRLHIEIVIEHISGLRKEPRESIMAALRDRWRIEADPELRIALARVLGSDRL